MSSHFQVQSARKHFPALGLTKSTLIMPAEVKFLERLFVRTTFPAIPDDVQINIYEGHLRIYLKRMYSLEQHTV
jgi:hypothetical protein